MSKEKVDALLKSVGAVLLRNKNHEIWKLPNGKQFVRAKTPSDTKASNNGLADLKRLLGIKGEKQETVKTPKKRTIGKDTTIHYDASINNSLAQKLNQSGIVESALVEINTDLKKQNRHLIEENEMLKTQNAMLSEELSNPCWCDFFGNLHRRKRSFLGFLFSKFGAKTNK